MTTRMRFTSPEDVYGKGSVFDPDRFRGMERFIELVNRLLADGSAKVDREGAAMGWIHVPAAQCAGGDIPFSERCHARGIRIGVVQDSTDIWRCTNLALNGK